MERKNFKKTLPKLVSLGLVSALCLTGNGAATVYSSQAGNTEAASGQVNSGSGTTDTGGAAGQQTGAAAGTQADAQYLNERLSHNYSIVSGEYTMPEYTGDDVVYPIAAAVVKLGGAKLDTGTRGYTGGDKVLNMKRLDKVTLKLNVPQDGQYCLSYDYLSYDESILPIKFKMKVDGDYSFYELRNLEFETSWQKNAEKEYDRYNNELVTVPNKMIRWESKCVSDASYRHSAPLKLQLSKGEHQFELEIEEGTFLLGNVTLKAPEKIPEYTGSDKAEGSELITLQGEDYTYTNDSSIHGVAEYDTSLDPYEVKDTVLNTIDSDSFADAGHAVSYEFETKEAGNYNIAMNYRQSDKTDFPVFVDVSVDGKIPNTAFQNYCMAYTTKYRTSTMQDKDGNNLSLHLDAGKHVITFTISMDPICNVMESLDQIMSDVNDLALEITKVAGTNADKYRDLKLTKYMPDVTSTLNKYADRLEELEKSCIQYSESDKNVAVMASMLIAADQLRDLAANPDEIPYRIDELSSSSNSANQYLANTIDNLIKNNLAIDRIYVYQEGASLPKGSGFFKSIGMNISRFVSSFTDQTYSASKTNKDHLQVWVNRSSQYVQIMQKMIDESFTPQTGIQVDISIMPDQYKLVLANSTGNAPDVATGINYTIPYELAVRGALVDMTRFEDFKQVAAPYEPGFFLTGTINSSVYSMPETMNFWVQFVRTDTMEKLGLKIPETMDDVIDLLPELQMRGLNFYYPTAGMTSMRNFHGTTPLIVQNGGSLYYDDASKGTALGEETSVDGFTELTDLFTIYNMDVNVDNFYQHFRNGDLPIGMADLANYNLLKNAAPELSSSWKIQAIPGTLKEDGSIDRSTCGCAESSVIFDKKDDERAQKAWEFIKWWSSDDVQAKFGQTIQITYGDEYMWPTANINAFSLLPWDTGDKEIIKEWAKNVVDVARVPGTYLLEREMSNAFNDIAVNGATAQTRIDKAVKVINREIDRKLEEFGYIDADGNQLNEYRIPTIENVKRILGRQ